ncbi:RNA-binding protein RO60-like [Mytilus edulis]|uniref:RNA-binding protein RO60-like n=1 Tax=Mytilus edulis TaxID=6550 RepID=UPI0039EE9087
MEVDPQSRDVHPIDEIVPQSQPLVGQIPNPSGGYSYQISDLESLLRFLCLGVNDRVYRANTQHTEFGRANVNFIDRLIQNGRGSEVIRCIRDVSIQGRACKHDTTLYALAICARSNDLHTKRSAYAILNDVCRIPTHLFQFVKYCEELFEHNSGWGRAHRMGISNWYNSFQSKDPQDHKSAKKLAYLVTKYKRRHGWTHRDAVRLAHVHPRTTDIRLIIEYIFGENITVNITPNQASIGEFLDATRRAKRCNDVEEIRSLIVKYHLSREHIPTRFLNNIAVWEVLLRTMPFTAMLRNLGKITSLGMLNPNTNASSDLWITIILQRLGQLNSDGLNCQKIHPLTILIALKHYEKGHGQTRGLVWTPNTQIVNALKEAFNQLTKICPPEGQSYLMAVSVGESMQKNICGSSIKACEAAAAMVLSTVNTADVEVIIFANSIEDACISSIARGDNLDSISEKIKRVKELCQQSPGNVNEDLAVPFKWAASRKKRFDVIVVLTDSLTSCGYMHPAEMLKQYMRYVAVDEYHLIVVGMTDNDYTIASPIDMNALDVVGFDLHTPSVIKNFVNDFRSDPSIQTDNPYVDLEEMENVTLY